MDLKTEILRYIDEKGEEGCSWSELEIRFVSREQLLVSLRKRSKGKGEHSKGAFVNAMKDLQRGEEPLIKKILVKGNPRYVITVRGKSELGKEDLTIGIKNKELVEIELPSQTTFNFFFNSIKKQVDVVRHSSLNPLDKLSGKKGEFYGNFYAQIFAERYSKYIKLNIMHPKGQKPPNLDVVFGRIKKIQGMKVLDVLHYCFVSVAGEYEREMGNSLPFQLLLTYDPPPINYEDLLKEVSVQTKDLYQKWLLKFNQKDSIRKENDFALELSGYIKEIHKRRLKTLQKS